MNNPSSENGGNRVLRFPTRRKPRPEPPQPPVADLTRYEQSEESEADYRRRMIVNMAGFGFVVALVAAALWLTDTMATLRKNQDCVLSGRSGCTPVDYQPVRR